MTKEMHNSYKLFLFHSFLLYMFRTNYSFIIRSITLYTVLHSTIGTIVLCNTVYYAMLLMKNEWIRSKHVEQIKILE